MSAATLGRIRMAARYGVGGPSWTVTTPAAGLGGGPTSTGTVMGKAIQGRLGGQGVTAPGQGVATALWYFVASSGTLAAGQELTDGTYTLSVTGLAAPGVYAVERL